MPEWTSPEPLPVGDSAVEKLGALAGRGREIARLRRELARVAQHVHSRSHGDQSMNWTARARAVCMRVRRALKREPEF